MKNPDPIQQYLGQLEANLPGDKNSSRRVLDEVEDHLRQRAAQLQEAGWEPPMANQEAIARFGAADQIASRLKKHFPLPCEEEMMMRNFFTALVALTTLYAALHIFFGLLGEPAELFTYIKVSLAAAVIVFSLLIARWQWTSRELSETQRIWIFCGGLGLIEIGTANVVWTAHLGLVTGDWEFYGFVGGVLISLLGTLAAIWMAFPEFPEFKDDAKLTPMSG